MELDEFINNTLTDIVSGIQKANQKLESSGSYVCSSHLSQNLGEGARRISKDKNGNLHVISEINFDVAVTASNSSKDEAGGGIKVFSVVKLGGSISNDTANNEVSRIQFSIPLALPHNSIEEE